MRHIAIIGSGPAGFYTAEAALKALPEVQVDIYDRLPTPYGLIRAGVAPDHQSIKAVSRRYAAVALDPRTRFVGGVRIGDDVAVDALAAAYDAVVIATGAPRDRPLGIPGEDLPGVLGSAAFVGWYNGHPDFAELQPALDAAAAVVIGHGNVAIDCARILAKTPSELSRSDIAGHALDALERSRVRDIRVIGRRGPHQVSFTPKELGELGELERATTFADPAAMPPTEADAALEPGLRKVVGHLRAFASRPADPGKATRLEILFFARPVAFEGDGKLERIRLERTRLEGSQAVGTGEAFTVPCGLAVTAAGYRSTGIAGLPFDDAAGRYANTEGHVVGNVWCVGWARRGPTGTIGTNRPDGIGIVERLAPTLGGDARPGFAAIAPLLGAQPTSFADWQRIDAGEVARARAGAPREKFTTLEAMRAALG